MKIQHTLLCALFASVLMNSSCVAGDVGDDDSKAFLASKIATLVSTIEAQRAEIARLHIELDQLRKKGELQGIQSTEDGNVFYTREFLCGFTEGEFLRGIQKTAEYYDYLLRVYLSTGTKPTVPEVASQLERLLALRERQAAEQVRVSPKVSETP